MTELSRLVGTQKKVVPEPPSIGNAPVARTDGVGPLYSSRRTYETSEPSLQVTARSDRRRSDGRGLQFSQLKVLITQGIPWLPTWLQLFRCSRAKNSAIEPDMSPRPDRPSHNRGVQHLDQFVRRPCRRLKTSGAIKYGPHHATNTMSDIY